MKLIVITPEAERLLLVVDEYLPLLPQLRNKAGLPGYVFLSECGWINEGPSAHTLGLAEGDSMDAYLPAAPDPGLARHIISEGMDPARFSFVGGGNIAIGGPISFGV